MNGSESQQILSHRLNQECESPYHQATVAIWRSLPSPTPPQQTDLFAVLTVSPNLGGKSSGNKVKYSCELNTAKLVS